MKKGVLLLFFLPFVAWFLFHRSFQSMAFVAKYEFLDHMQDIGVDTAGFIGPMVHPEKGNILVFRWDKSIDDSTKLFVDVGVDSRWFMETSITGGGPAHAWKMLVKQKDK
jgi:hypothetical protein